MCVCLRARSSRAKQWTKSTGRNHCDFSRQLWWLCVWPIDIAQSDFLLLCCFISYNWTLLFSLNYKKNNCLDSFSLLTLWLNRSNQFHKKKWCKFSDLTEIKRGFCVTIQCESRRRDNKKTFLHFVRIAFLSFWHENRRTIEERAKKFPKYCAIVVWDWNFVDLLVISGERNETKEKTCEQIESNARVFVPATVIRCVTTKMH